jgi:hypothetical protein
MLKFFLTVVLMLVALLLIGAASQPSQVEAQTVYPTHQIPPCPGSDRAGRPLTGEVDMATGQLRCIYGLAHDEGECFPTNGRRADLYSEAVRADGRIACVYGEPQ